MSNNLLSSQKAAYDYIHKTLEVYMKSSQTILPHFIMSGSTGTGKSMLIQSVANKYGIPVLSLNGAQITPEGMQGASLSKLLVPLEKVSGRPIVVLIDEFDKVFQMHQEKSGVQQEILHMISSKRVDVIGQFGHYNKVKLDKVLFIFAGAFGNREEVSPEYLLRMGMEPELLGRVNLHVHVPNVDMDEILKAVDKEILFKQYQATLQLSDKDIEAAIISVKERIKEIWERSVIGYRVIQRVTHQYFLLDGNYPDESSEEPEAVDLDDLDSAFNENGDDL